MTDKDLSQDRCEDGQDVVLRSLDSAVHAFLSPMNADTPALCMEVMIGDFLHAGAADIERFDALRITPEINAEFVQLREKIKAFGSDGADVRGLLYSVLVRYLDAVEDDETATSRVSDERIQHVVDLILFLKNKIPHIFNRACETPFRESALLEVLKKLNELMDTVKSTEADMEVLQSAIEGIRKMHREKMASLKGV